jgi:hypothetical protein
MFAKADWEIYGVERQDKESELHSVSATQVSRPRVPDGEWVKQGKGDGGRRGSRRKGG